MFGTSHVSSIEKTCPNKHMVTHSTKPVPARVGVLLMVEVALASCILLVAPFEALTAQRHLTGLIIAIGASILVVVIDIAKQCMLGRAVPESTPLS